MSITDQTVLSEIQRLTLENAGDAGVSWPSGMWTQAEVLGYLNQRQDRFLGATGIIWKRDERNITLSQANQAHPTDWIATYLIAYRTGASRYVELPRVDALELDFILSTWPASTTATIPKGYYEVDGDTTTANVVPIPTEVGSGLERYYAALGTVLDASGIAFTVPDEFVPTIKYGALADMLAKVGPAQNASLAEACLARWEEGLQYGILIGQAGWFAG